MNVRDYSSIRNDFEVRLRFLTADEGGRKTPWVAQGYRCDFSYADDAQELFMIWPVFVDAEGRPLAHLEKVYAGIYVDARMTVVNPELRTSLHRERIKTGTAFYLREGAKVVAEGVVTLIVDLLKD